jgi:hypothetical protein
MPRTSKLRLLVALLFLSLGGSLLVCASGIGGWSLFPSPNGTTRTNALYGVACSSVSDCWAAGSQNINPDYDHTLVEHWDGAAWTVATSPNTATTDNNVLYGITCASASECWAVGFYQSSNSNFRQTLILKWNGNAWKVAASPNASSTQNNILYSVACSSASQCWAIGGYNNGTADLTLIEKWNGTAWKIVASANATSPYGNYLKSVTCASATECWADGYYFDPNGLGTPLIERWNGTSWSLTASAPVHGELNSITCAAPSDCWVAGSYANGNVSQTLFEHWDGTAWLQVDAPSVAPVQRHLLLGLSCGSSASCWMVGFYTDINNGADHTLIEHWDGASWSLDPTSSRFAQFAGVACPSPLQCWAVGLQYAGNGVYETLTEKYFPPLSVESVRHAPSDHFDISGQAAPSTPVNIEASPDLVSPFQSIGTTTADSSGTFQFDDASAPSLIKRFYRASYP